MLARSIKGLIAREGLGLCLGRIDMAGNVRIDQQRCKGCGLCIDVCPNGCITVAEVTNDNGYLPAKVDCEHCSGCGLCGTICPDAAIEVWVVCDKAKGRSIHLVKGK